MTDQTPPSTKPFFSAAAAMTPAVLDHGTANPDAVFYVSSLSVSKPDGSLLINPFSFSLKEGERLMISGASGCGKSTITRAAHNLWPWSSGTIGIRPDVRTLIIAQKPHLPLTTLRNIVCYPESGSEFSNEDVAAALTKAGLGRLVADMNDEARDGAHWERLSGGEKQRISFARILLHKPTLLMLDEVTASLDIKSQDELYRALLNDLPDSTMISISHRTELAQYHNRLAVIENQEFRFTPTAPGPRTALTPA